MSSMNDLYQTVIIEHDRSPRNFRVLEGATHAAEGRNPLCGDEVAVALTVDDHDVITDVAFQGNGCAVSRASASMMTVSLKGKTTTEARELFDQFRSLLVDGGEKPAQLGKLVAFEGLGAYPMRVKCATLAWHAVVAALDAENKPVSTEE